MRTSGGAVVQNPQSYSTDSITGNPNQEWDIQSAGNCGDIPANCTNPPLTATGNYYTIVNKATGLLLSANGTDANASIELQAPTTASNGDFTVPARKVSSGRSFLSTSPDVRFIHSMVSSHQLRIRPR